MKLFHRGYQGKHERGQVPRQREAGTRQRAADDQEAQERVSDPILEDRALGPDLPAQRPSPADESTGSSQPQPT